MDDRTVTCIPRLNCHRAAASYLDDTGRQGGVRPSVRCAVSAGMGGVELFEVQVLRIGARMGDVPRHRSVVSEMRQAWHPREGRASSIELGTREMYLPVDGGNVQPAMRVIADHRLSCRDTASVDRPGVRPTLKGSHRPKDSNGVGQFSRATGDEATNRAITAGRQEGGRPGRRPLVEFGVGIRTDPEKDFGLGDLLLPDTHQHVTHTEHGDRVPRLPRCRHCPGQGVFRRKGQS